MPSYVVVVAATNHAELLDRAVWRRFQVRLELKAPDKSMIKIWLKNFEQRVKYDLQYPIDKIANKLEGLNFAEIEEFILDVERKYILSLPDVNVKRLVDECLVQMEHKYSLGNG